jgi:hypothetical protein
MQPVAAPLLELEDRPPLPEPRQQIHVAAGGRAHDGDASLALLADLVRLDHRLDLGDEIRRVDAVGFVREVLPAPYVPADHGEEHHQPPHEGDGDPGNLDLLDRLFPPNLRFGRMYRHGADSVEAGAGGRAGRCCWR